VDVVIGADGANSRVAKDIEAGDYEYAIAFQAIAAIAWYGAEPVKPV
jgi:flavin-dependent dehydrogenase